MLKIIYYSLNNCYIHRCTDIMGHIGEKFRLGAACVFRRPVRILQCLMGFDLGLFSCDTSIDANSALTSFVPSHSSGMKEAIL